MHGELLIMENIEIDLEEMKKNEDMLNESFLRMYGTVVELMLKHMFGIPVFGPSSRIKGKPSDVRAFARAVGNEKKYIEIAKKHGLDNPRTYKQKGKLDKAVKAFELKTGIKWPFK
tara:strand:- start:1910 stop:2257 length:348 start_codon:yes stop_codon:yes gene_type:complete